MTGRSFGGSRAARTIQSDRTLPASPPMLHDERVLSGPRIALPSLSLSIQHRSISPYFVSFTHRAHLLLCHGHHHRRRPLLPFLSLQCSAPFPLLPTFVPCGAATRHGRRNPTFLLGGGHGRRPPPLSSSAMAALRDFAGQGIRVCYNLPQNCCGRPRHRLAATGGVMVRVRFLLEPTCRDAGTVLRDVTNREHRKASSGDHARDGVLQP